MKTVAAVKVMMNEFAWISSVQEFCANAKSSGFASPCDMKSQLAKIIKAAVAGRVVSNQLQVVKEWESGNCTELGAVIAQVCYFYWLKLLEYANQ